jgi:hypothetical protein
MMSDYNERLVKNPVPELDMQILLENIEIMSKQMEFDSEGNPLLETYTFMARDERLLKPIASSSNMTPYVPDRIDTGSGVNSPVSGLTSRTGVGNVTRY